MSRPVRAFGFSMMELILVIVIVAILGAVAAPRMLERSSIDQWGFHDQVVAAMQYARKSAVASRRHVCVELSGGQMAFTRTIAKPEDSPLCSSVAALSLPDRGGNALTVPSGIGTAALSPSQFYFDALGRPMLSGGTPTKVEMTIPNQPTITIEQETGFVH